MSHRSHWNVIDETSIIDLGELGAGSWPGSPGLTAHLPKDADIALNSLVPGGSRARCDPGLKRVDVTFTALQRMRCDIDFRSSTACLRGGQILAGYSASIRYIPIKGACPNPVDVTFTALQRMRCDIAFGEAGAAGQRAGQVNWGRCESRCEWMSRSLRCNACDVTSPSVRQGGLRGGQGGGTGRRARGWDGATGQRADCAAGQGRDGAAGQGAGRGSWAGDCGGTGPGTREWWCVRTRRGGGLES
jgi:hypothetical protein